jgi:hypothetical protein
MAIAKTKTNENGRSGWKRRAWLVLGIVTFVGSFQQVYLKWLYPVFGYYGFENSNPMIGYLCLAWGFSVGPALWMPIKLTRPSQLIYWVLYLTVFIPSMFVPLYAGLQDAPEVASLMLVLFLGFAITGMSYLLPLLTLHPPRISLRSYGWFFCCLAAVLVLWVLLVFRGNLRIVSFADVYDLRSAADDVMEGSSVHYAVMWLSAVIGPTLLAWAIVRKRAFVFLAGVLVQVLVYSATGAKSVVVSVVVVPVLAFVLRDKGASFGLKVGWSCALMTLVLYLGRSLGGSDSLFFWLFSLVFMRTFGNSGLTTAWYYDFFLRNPLTYYSHIKGVSWFVRYPYINPLGIEIGSFYSGDPTLDANAHFWATDGLAAWGLSGILLISVVCALLFWVLDSSAKGHDLRLAALVVSFAALNLANISLFTSLLSGGLGLLIILLYFAPRHLAESVNTQTGYPVMAPLPQL